eukprot:3969674-Heterocapsa_arctica.AAC.1
MADCVKHAVGSITRFFSKRPTDDRTSDAGSSGIHPRAMFHPRATTDISAERPCYTEHPA